MASAKSSSQGAEQDAAGHPDDDFGDKVHDDIKTRQAQQNGNSENCLEINLTKFGKEYHGIEKGQLLEVEVRENAIVIKEYEIATGEP